MTAWVRWISILLLLTPACGGGGFTTRDAPAHSSGDREPLVAGWRQAELPARNQRIDVLGQWDQGDAALRGGDAEAAQYHFGAVYLADPNFGQGQVGAALTETCRVLNNDCALVMGRLDLLRLVYAEQLGPRSDWVPQQETDFGYIKGCYDHALMGYFDDAYASGYSAVNAPLPQFAGFARLCLDRVQMIRSQIQLANDWQEAVIEWEDNRVAFRDAFADLQFAILDDDWDAIVDIYPGYKLTEEPIALLTDSGVLEEHPEYGEEVQEAASLVAEIRDWEVDHYVVYEQMRDAINILELDASYNQALIEYEAAYAPIPGLRSEIDTLEMARDATSGSEQRGIERRIDAKEAEIRDIRRSLRRLMIPINEMRQAMDLPERDEPYGLE